MITAQITRGKKVPQQLKATGELFDSAVALTVQRLAIKMTNLVKMKLSDNVLRVKTGRLRRSINYSVDYANSKTTAIVGTNVEYAGIHEFGGVIPARIVYPKKKSALKFTVGGKVVFAKRANIPAVKMPQRSFLQSSLAQMTPEIRSELVATVNAKLKTGVRA